MATRPVALQFLAPCAEIKDAIRVNDLTDLDPPPIEMKIELRNIHKAYGSTSVLQGVSLVIEPNEMFFLLGPSGCGKTTLLRMLAGFIAPDEGEILFDGKRVNDLPPEKRRVPMVFQNYALWPHLSVFENAAYGLRVQKLPEAEIRRQTMKALEITRLETYADRAPGQLSGGQQQRVAISRALAVNPSALLFDEPLSNLDARLRVGMRAEILGIHHLKPFTAVYVTHDQEEAMSMATRIGVLDQGKLHQVGTPQELYRQPANRFVAEFMGPINWMTARVQTAHKGEPLLLETPLGVVRVSEPGFSISAGQEVLAGFRPSSANFSVAKENHANKFSCEVLETQYAGSCQNLTVRVGAGKEGVAEIKFQLMESNPHRVRQRGERVEVSVDPEQMMVMPP